MPLSLSNLLDSTWYIATCLSVPRALIDAVWERDGSEVDGLSGRDRGNEIIADLLSPLLSIVCFICVSVCACVCMHVVYVCLALFSAKIYIKIALHLTSTLLNEAHESGGRHVVWHVQQGWCGEAFGSCSLLGLSTALL